MKKKIICLCMAALLAMPISSMSADAMTLFYAGTGTLGWFGVTEVYVAANTTEDYLTYEDASIGLKGGKYVDYVTIRLREGDYDERLSTFNGYIELSKKNNPFKKQYGTWKWTYR